MLPLVTAVIPCHNHAHWVEDAVASVVAQDYPNKRLVVVDDGSTDTSTAAVLGLMRSVNTPAKQEEVWAAWGLIEGVVTMVQQLPRSHGPAFARNWGMRVAWEGTDAFAFLDSDDVYLPGKISKSIELIRAATFPVGVVYSDFDTVRPDGLRLRQYKEPYSRERLLRECIANCDSLVTREAIERCGDFDEDLRVCEDYDLWLRISEHFVLLHVPESLVDIRVGEHSSTSRVATDTWQRCHARVFQKLDERAHG